MDSKELHSQGQISMKQAIYSSYIEVLAEKRPKSGLSRDQNTEVKTWCTWSIGFLNLREI